jgi:predicted metal-dependent RNase
MAALTHAQEYEAIRQAIQQFTTSNVDVASVNVDGMTITYSRAKLDWLQQRERELAKRLSQRNVRKRVIPDFSGGTNII